MTTVSSLDTISELGRPPTYTSIDATPLTIGLDLPAKGTSLVSSPTLGCDYNFIASGRGLQIRHGDKVLYHVGCHEAVGFSDVVVYAGYDQYGPQLARANFILNSKDFNIYVGGLRSPSGDDWDVVRHASDGKLFSAPYFRFESPGPEAGTTRKKKYFGKKTHDGKLGASKLSPHDYKLVDEATDEVVAVYLETMRAGRVGRTLRFLIAPNEAFAIVCILVLCGILEKSKRFMKAVARAFPAAQGW